MIIYCDKGRFGGVYRLVEDVNYKGGMKGMGEGDIWWRKFLEES